MRIAVTRDISPAIERCELTHLPRVAIDLAVARAQHAAYERCLSSLGCAVRRLAADPELPDCVFVEDVAVVFDELAVVTRPGAASRRAEVSPVAAALAEYRTLRAIEPPGTLDGGDVLVAGRRVFVGRTPRSDAAGVAQLRDALRPHGYEVRGVEVRGCLHLKTAVTAVADDLLLVDPRCVSTDAFDDLKFVEIDPAEPFAANALRVGESIVYPSAFPRTRERLERLGLDVRVVDASELAKAEGGVTCCSLIFEE
jgi:dimethylargininase